MGHFKALEGSLCTSVARIKIGVVTTTQTAECSIDGFIVGIKWNAEHGVMIPG
jgi:hypothetical protein